MWIIILFFLGAAYSLVAAGVSFYKKPTADWRRVVSIDILTGIAFALMAATVLVVNRGPSWVLVCIAALGIPVVVLYFRIIVRRPQRDR